MARLSNMPSQAIWVIDKGRRRRKMVAAGKAAMRKSAPRYKTTSIVSVLCVQRPDRSAFFIGYCACGWFSTQPECYPVVLELVAHIGDKSYSHEVYNG